LRGYRGGRDDRLTMRSIFVVVGLAYVAACDPPLQTLDPPAVRIFPESAATGDAIGVYAEVDDAKGGSLELQAFDGTVCGIGPATNYVPADAGAGPCSERVSYAVTTQPQTFALVFQLQATGQSGLLGATLFDIAHQPIVSTFRRIYRAPTTTDAGVDAMPAADATTGDAQ
jgi:hypothetical protein